MTPKQLMELEGFDKDIKWITKDADGSVKCFLYDKPYVTNKKEWHCVNESNVSPVNLGKSFDVDFGCESWTKCIYEREKDPKDMIGKWGWFYMISNPKQHFGKLKSTDPFRDTDENPWPCFDEATAKDIKEIMDANGITKEQL